MRWAVRKNWLGCAAAFALVGCGIVDGRTDGGFSVPQPAAHQSGVASDNPVRIGEPYLLNGVRYVPADDPFYDETGYAVFYDVARTGQTTASGETYDPAAISAAHHTLPLPSYLEVAALDTGRTIVVRVNDRGPSVGGGLIALSPGAAEQLGIGGAGMAGVRVRRVNPSEPEKGLLRAGKRAPARMDMPETVLVELRKRLPSPASAAPPATPQPQAHIAATAMPTIKPAAKPSPGSSTPKPVPATKPPPILARGIMVQIGAYSSRQGAEAIAKRLGGAASPSGKLWRVRTGPYADQAAAQRGIEKATAAGFPGARIVVND